MIANVIAWSLRNRFLVLLATAAVLVGGLWAMRTTKGNRPPNTGSGLPSSPMSLVPQATPRLYRAGPNDVITHIDGVAVTSFEGPLAV